MMVSGYLVNRCIKTFITNVGILVVENSIINLGISDPTCQVLEFLKDLEYPWAQVLYSYKAPPNPIGQGKGSHSCVIANLFPTMLSITWNK